MSDQIVPLRRLLARLRAHPATRLLAIAVIVLLSGFLAYKAVTNQVSVASVGREDRDSLQSLIDHTAARPFVFRILTPTLVHLVDQALPLTELGRALPGSMQGKLDLLCGDFTAQPAVPCRTVDAYLIVAGGYVLVFLLTVAALTQRLVRPGLLPALGGVALAFLTVNAILLLELSHAYDFGTLMFGALLLACLAWQRDLLFCLVLGVAVLNKETAIIYGLAFLATTIERLPLRRLALYLGLQAALFILLHGAVRLWFRGNPGSGIEIFLHQQIYYFTEHITLARLFGMLTAFIVVFYRFNRKHPVLRRASSVILPWFALFIVGGQQGELRVIFEVLPVILLLATDSLVAIAAPPAPA